MKRNMGSTLLNTLSISQAHTVSAIAAVDLANELITRGFIAREDLAEISNTLNTLYESRLRGLAITEKRVAECDFLSLWRVASEQSKLPSLGIEIGQTVNINAKGLLANWLSCCETLNQAFSVFQKNIPLLNQAECWSVSYQANDVKLSFAFSSDFVYPNMAIERSMVALLSWAEHFCEHKIDVQSASFTFDKPDYDDLFEPIFGANIRFNSDTNCIVLKTAQLDTPINGANAYLRNLIAKRSEALTLDMSPPLSTRAKVQQLLTLDLVKYSKLETLLSTLHMSRTTLYRKLKHDKSVFSELVLAERIKRLASIKQQNTDSETIAEALGFNDVSSYYKFIKRTTS